MARSYGSCDRSAGSSLVPEGEWILSDAQLRELGGFMAYVDASFPIDLGDYAREQVLLDMEFKLEREDGSLAVKQVRPFLISGPVVRTPTFAVEIPEGTMACGVFGLAGVDRGPRDEYELKSTVRFRGGRIELPTRAETFTGDLVEELRFGPGRDVAQPLERGLFRVFRLPGAGSVDDLSLHVQAGLPAVRWSAARAAARLTVRVRGWAG